MIIIKHNIFKKEEDFLDFFRGLEKIFDDEDYSGRNGLDFVSDDAKEAGYVDDFSFDFDNVYDKYSFMNFEKEMTHDLKEEIIKLMFDKYVNRSKNYYIGYEILITEHEGDIFVSVALECE